MKKEIMTYSPDGDVPGRIVDFVHLGARDHRTLKMLSGGLVEVIAEKLSRRVPEWTVIVRRAQQAAPIAGGIAIGTLTYEVLKHLQKEKEEKEKRKSK